MTQGLYELIVLRDTSHIDRNDKSKTCHCQISSNLL